MASVKFLPSNLNLVVQETATLTWTIDAFAELELVQSPEFSPPNSRNEFKLGICHFRYSVNVNDKYTFIILTYNGHQEEAYFRYRASVLDANGEKVYNREYIWYYSEFDGSGKMTWDLSNIRSHFTFYLPHEECAKLLVNGGMKLYCEVDFMGKNSLPPSAIESFGKLSQNYEDLLENGKLSDFIVQIGDKEFQVHKTVLTARSVVFASMFEHAETQEVKEGRIVIEDVEVDVFELLIRYIYTGKIEGFDEHADELFVAADKYQLDHLKSICEHSLVSSLTVESVCAVLLLSDMHNAEQLKSKCTEYIVKHAKEVMKTEGWKKLLKSKRIDLVGELFEKLAIKDDDH